MLAKLTHVFAFLTIAITVAAVPEPHRDFGHPVCRPSTRTVTKWNKAPAWTKTKTTTKTKWSVKTVIVQKRPHTKTVVLPRRTTTVTVPGPAPDEVTTTVTIPTTITLPGECTDTITVPGAAPDPVTIVSWSTTTVTTSVCPPPNPPVCTDFLAGSDCGEDFFCCPGLTCNEFLVCDIA